MPAWLWPALSAVGSFVGTGAGESRAAGRRESDLQRIMQLFSPQSIGGDTNSLFEMFQRSPMYSGLRNRSMESSALLGNQLQTNFARRGLSSSGIAGASLPIARASHMGSFDDIDMELFAKALSTVMQGRGTQANALGNFKSADPWGMAFGKTLDILGPYLNSKMGVR